MSYLALLKELFGKAGTQIICAILLGGLLVYSVPQYFVTAPVFAQAMQQMHKQMVIGDRLQEKQWLESEIDRLKNKKLAIYENAGGTFTAVETQAIRDIDEDIACKTRRIESINLQMQNNWMKGE